MRLIVRLALIAVLAVLMPLKGMAAAGYVPCGGRTGESTSAVGVDHASAQLPAAHASASQEHPHGDGHDHPGGEAHAAGHAEAPASDLASDSGGHGHGHGHDHGHAKCTHCAPCAAAVAPPAGVITLPHADLASRPPVTALAAWTGVTTPLPERPPRPHLA